MKYSYKRRQIERKAENIVNGLKKFHWKYRNLILLFVSLVIAYFILKYKPVTSLISELNSLSYLAAFILGMLFTYALTVAPATAALYNMGESVSPFLIALIGAFGSVISDYLIFRFVRDRLVEEIKLLAEEVNYRSKPISDVIFPERIKILMWRKISRSRVWKYLIPVVSGFIIASPLPDELGVALFGASRYEPKKFILYSYLLNFVGILFITSLAVV